MDNKRDLKNKIIAIILACFGFFGLAGLHRFYQRKIGTGLLYFFTFGLLGIGTLVDVILLVKDLISFIKSNGSNEYLIAEDTPSSFNITVKESITSDELNFEDTIHRYLTTSHSTVPSKYKFIEYYEAEFECILYGIPLHSIKMTDGNINRNKEGYLCPNYLQLRSNTNSYKLKNFISIDVATTGLSTSGGDILEVAAIKWINFRPVSIFTTLCKPRSSIPARATAINNISNEMVKNSPDFKSVVFDLEQFISNLPLVAYNAPFDLKFLYVCGLSSIENCNAYDVLQLSQNIVRDYKGEKLDSYKLEDVCEEMSIYFKDAHRASTDALAVGLLFIELIKSKKSTTNILSI